MSRAARLRPVLAVHGGCGRWDAREARETLPFIRSALEAGRSVLDAGGPALEAVCAAVVVLEDAGCFTAGAGALPNAAGVIELDAAVMDGWNGRAGGVAALHGVRNPVRVAQRVMRDTPHVLLAGEGARRFARDAGLAQRPRTPSRRAGGGAVAHDTVGAVARDSRGRLAAATSTGGIANKLPGRVGDSPIPGAGLYATRHAAVSTTGRGELMLAALTALRVADAAATAMAQRASAAEVAARLAGGARHALAALPFVRADAAGLIALASRGDPLAVIRGGLMPHGLLRTDGSLLLGLRPRAPRPR